MSPMTMGNHFGYTINGPQPEALDLPIRTSKSLSVRREPKLSGNNLRNLYQNPISPSRQRTSLSSAENGTLGQATPILPPTPPNAEEEVVDAKDEEAGDATELAKNRSVLATPVNRVSPPTPDNTPPREKPKTRPFLGAQPSMASTRAESFKTAHEDLPSDKESVASSPLLQPVYNHSASFLPPHPTNGVYKPSPLASLPITNGVVNSEESSPGVPSSAIMHSAAAKDEHTPNPVYDHRHRTSTFHSSRGVETTADTVNMSKHYDIEDEYSVKSRKEALYRGRSLRERLEDSRQVGHSPSLDKFATIIGWTNSVPDPVSDHRRWSVASNTSPVEALVIEKARPPKKHNTLRHVSKNESLRSASSPLPNSNRNSMQSSGDSPHLLVHKRAKLSNQIRLSFGSELPHAVSIGSSFAPEVEVIRVAVIPERSSSLQQSTAASSRRHSLSTTGAPTSFRMPRASDSSQRKRAETISTDRSRDRHYPPQVPARGSSLSAPTSRNTSRANSISSDHARSERKRAEKDLRTTLDKMECERLASSLKSASIENAPLSSQVDNLYADLESNDQGADSSLKVPSQSIATPANLTKPPLTPGSKEWAELRPTSTLYTPFSQPSFMSASPEISEAKMISLHPHNNHSVQLIEPFPLQESSAVGEARKLNTTHYLVTNDIDSPLRNPRRPPTPPYFQVTPATPLDEAPAQPDIKTPQNTAPSTPKRPANHLRTDSFAKTLLRNVSFKHARNKRADQDLDSRLHPFWRPRPFWDGIEGASPEKKRNTDTTEQGVVNNSLGLPQQRLVIAGPLGLVRKMSERRRNRKVLAHQSSYTSLQRLRTGRRLKRLPGLGMHLHLITLRDLQERVHASRQRREDDKREKRREALRKSIGPNIIATGDSRFLTTMTDSGDSN